ILFNRFIIRLPDIHLNNSDRELIIREISAETFFLPQGIVMAFEFLGNIGYQYLVLAMGKVPDEVGNQVTTVKKIGTDVTEAFYLLKIRIDEHIGDIPCFTGIGKTG